MNITSVASTAQKGTVQRSDEDEYHAVVMTIIIQTFLNWRHLQLCDE